jgi:hypothetical protein
MKLLLAASFNLSSSSSRSRRSAAFSSEGSNQVMLARGTPGGWLAAWCAASLAAEGKRRWQSAVVGEVKSDQREGRAMVGQRVCEGSEPGASQMKMLVLSEKETRLFSQWSFRRSAARCERWKRLTRLDWRSSRSWTRRARAPAASSLLPTCFVSLSTSARELPRWLRARRGRQTVRSDRLASEHPLEARPGIRGGPGGAENRRRA